MSKGWTKSLLAKFSSWTEARSLWFYVAHSGCCADEVLETLCCRYDLERFGCVQQTDPSRADLLLVNGAVAPKAVIELKRVYEKMPTPRFVMAIGACASCGGPFNSKNDSNYAGPVSVDQILPVDVYIPGCPPRPEAIMEGLIKLQEKIRGKR